MSAKKRSAGRIVLTVIAALLGVIVLVAAVFVIIPLTETVETYQGKNSVGWMAALPDDMPINEVVLPGTHDSSTQFVHLGFLAKCQALSVREQLEAGYRYFDLRMEVAPQETKMKHGFLDCQVSGWPWSKSLTLDDVFFGQVREFLTIYESEFIVFSVKMEHGDGSIADLQHRIRGTLGSEYMLLTDKIPTVGEARGKIVVMRRYEDEGGRAHAGGIPFIWQDQGNRDNTSLAAESYDQGSYMLTVQDRYKYDSDDTWKAFTDTLAYAQAAGSAGKPEIVVNFLSTNGNTTYGHPYAYARDLNERFLKLDSKDLSGWIIVDFGSGRMAEKIWLANFD